MGRMKTAISKNWGVLIFFIKKMGQSSAVEGFKTAVRGSGWTIELSTQLYVIIYAVFMYTWEY